MAMLKTLTINGVTYNVTPVVPASSVTLLASAWVGDGDAYSQVVEIPGVTAHTRVDLQLTLEQLAIFHDKDLAFVTENEDGVVTVSALGDKPTNDYTMQVTLTEVHGGVGKKIYGVTVGTTTSPGYMERKINPVKTVNGVSADENGNVNVAGGGSSSDIEQMKQDIASIKADLYYVAIDITKISCTAAGTHEMGEVVNNFTISWTLNKEPASQNLGGVALATDVRQKEYTGQNITGNKTYTLSVTDERDGTDSASTSITFLNGVYYGVMTDGATIDSAAVLKLTKELRGDRKKTFTANTSAGQKHAFAIPSRYGTPTFKDAETGFQAGFYLAKTIQFTNASDYTEEYHVWLSTNPGMGSMTVAVS